MKRRTFLTGLATLPVTATKAFAEQHAQLDGEPSTGTTTHLDLAAAEKIKDAFLIQRLDQTDLLDLTSYKSASAEAIAILGTLEVGFTRLGLDDLTLPVAQALGVSKSYFLIFDNLPHISPEAAHALVPQCEGHSLVFNKLTTLNAETAALLAQTEGLLDLRLSAPLPPSVARALADHTHELSITLAGEALLPGSELALTFHRGYRLEIYSESPLTEASMRFLQSNPKKEAFVSSPAEQNERCDTNCYSRWLTTLIEVANDSDC